MRHVKTEYEPMEKIMEDAVDLGTTDEEIKEIAETMEAVELERFEELFPVGYTTLDGIRKDLVTLQGERGAGGYFPKVIPRLDDFGEDVISILDLLDNLDDFKVDDLDTEDILLADYSIEKLADNSYNWGSPISHDFDFHVFENKNTSEVLVTLKVHRFGDVRVNYTRSAILRFYDESEFFEVLLETNKMIEYFDHTVDISILKDGYDVFDAGGEHLGEIYHLDHDTKEEFLGDLS